MADRPLAEVPLGPRGDVLRITREGSGLNLRRWFTSASGEMRPGREGMAFTPAELDLVLGALRAARARLTGAGAL